MGIINAGIPPSVRPKTSNMLNWPITNRLFQSFESMNEICFAYSTPGNTMKDKDIPKKTWNSMGQASLKATRELVTTAVTRFVSSFSFSSTRVPTLT